MSRSIASASDLTNVVGIAADHGGHELKEYLVGMLRERAIAVSDFGDSELNSDDDYPDFVIPMARAVATGEVERGIAICGSGVGASIAANKVPGVRACLIHEMFSAHQGVEDDDLNVMCLGGLVVGHALAWELVQTFLSASFSGVERHRRRLEKVATLEDQLAPQTLPGPSNTRTGVSRIDEPDIKTPLYPLRFEPIYQYRIWGGRRLASLLSAPLPGDEPIGEAWLLSDRVDHPSLVADGPLKGMTLTQVLTQWPEQLLGKWAGRFRRFPLLLKYLDVRNKLSVQVHPSDQQTNYLPAGESGKTEAWVVLEAGESSRIYAGLKSGVTREALQQALNNGKVTDCIASFRPNSGDAILIPAGTVHSLSDAVVFEVQENSDVTFRLYDWNHIDTKTGTPRPLQIEQALACIDYEQGEVRPVVPIVDDAQPNSRERLFDCEHFCAWRHHSESPITVGIPDAPRVLVCLEGEGQIEHGRDNYEINPGDVLLLPAVVGACLCRPRGAITLLEISLPDDN